MESNAIVEHTSPLFAQRKLVSEKERNTNSLLDSKQTKLRNEPPACIS